MSITISPKSNFSIHHIPKPNSQHPLSSEEHENPYSHTVLIGNWFEERFANKIDRKAITPGVYGQSICFPENSLYKTDFKQPIALDAKEDLEEYVNWKQQGFNNRLSSEHTNIKLWDGDQFVNNVTTFKDIMYRIKPEEAIRKKEPLLIRRRNITEDYMRSFGNSTKTGLLLWRECEKKREDGIPLDVSHYKNNFKPIKLPERRYLCKAEQRKTSI